MMQQFDVIIIGGGMVGSTLACGLAMQQRRVALIDPMTPEPFEPDAEPDLRLSAFSLGSEQLLKNLQAWPLIQAMRLTPYVGLQTWEQGQAAKLQFSSEQINQERLGSMIENRIVQLALRQRCQTLGVSVLPWQNWQLSQSDSSVIVSCEGEQLQAVLAIGADGANSQVRDQLGIGITGWDYRQRCLSINVRFAEPPERITWQEFRPTGPRALLPLFDRYGALIWYDRPERIKKLQTLNAHQLKQQILEHFPAIEHEFELLRWASFPLTRRHASTYYQGRVALAGDCAHSIHPLAGQGVNIGFKDVSEMLSLCDGQALEQMNIESLLARYQRARRGDNLVMQSTMDLLYKGFSVTHPLGIKVRQLVLQGAEHSGVLKKRALRYAVGL